MKRVITLILAAIALASVIYAIVQKRIAHENLRVAHELRLKLDACATEANMQRQLAERAAQRAAEVQRQAEAELRKCKGK